MNKSLQRSTSNPWKQTLLIAVSALTILGVLSFIMFPSASSPSSTLSPISSSGSKTSIVHIVMFEFKKDAKEDQISDVITRMLALKDQCVHPETKKPYVAFGIGGKQNSPEGLTAGITHIFIEEFANAEDRTYYLEKDPVHLAFVKSIGGVVEKAQVVDFTPGVF